MHITLFGFDNHAFLFFSAFICATIRDERLSLIHPSPFESSGNVLAPLLSSPCDTLPLLSFEGNQEKPISSRHNMSLAGGTYIVLNTS